MDFTTLSDREHIDRLIVHSSQLGFAHSIPLLRAARDGLLAVVAIRRDAEFPTRGLGKYEERGRPVVLLVGDDDGISSGPAGWRAATKARWWAASSLVHAAGGEAEHYTAAVMAAMVCKRLLIIETTTAQGPAWVDFIQARVPPLGGLVIHVPEGKPAHPFAERMQ